MKIHTKIVGPIASRGDKQLFPSAVLCGPDGAGRKNIFEASPDATAKRRAVSTLKDEITRHAERFPPATPQSGARCLMIGAAFWTRQRLI